MLETKLKEVLNRYNSINRYGKKLVVEQEAPPAEPVTDPATDAPDPAMDAAPPATDVPASDVPAPSSTEGDVPAPDAMPEGGDETEELDITDLVNMTKAIKKDLEDRHQDTDSGPKMDELFSKLGEIEQKIGMMDQIINRIDMLGAKVDRMKPKTPEEQLNMRSLDSYPFNENPGQFFQQKQATMRAAGKNEYVLTKDDIQNYSPEEMKNSFNVQEKDPYKF